MIITHSIYSPTNPSEGDWWETGTNLFLFETGNWKMMSNVECTYSPNIYYTCGPSIYSPSNPKEGDWWETGTALFMFDGECWKMIELLSADRVNEKWMGKG